MSSNENLQDATDFSSDASHQQENVVHDSINHGCAISTHEIAEKANDVLEVIASTGKFWHNWDKLKNMLSFQLKQVWGEYPEAKMSSNEQISTLGETSAELVGRLDEALCSFTEGPPFTLQRLCEILLNARSIYPNLSKLALALEKNLLVTSTLTMSTGPYPSEATENINEADKGRPEVQSRSNSVPNGVESEKDEVMAEAEESGSGDGMAIDTEGEALKEK